METTERQQKILNTIIEEYIDCARPISSQLLEKKHNFGLSPASIRIEMQKLTDAGFLYQPHTSAGRVPTDKGYRFFVDDLLEKKSEESEVEDWFEEEVEDTFKFVRSLTRHLAEESRALTLNYLENEDIFWKEGWEEVLKEPEFGERDNIINFTKLLKNFEDHIKELEKGSGVNVCIGKENPFPKAKDFSVISCRYRLPNGGEGVISLLGPKRMAYNKNISLINSLTRLLDEF